MAARGADVEGAEPLGTAEHHVQLVEERPSTVEQNMQEEEAGRHCHGRGMQEGALMCVTDGGGGGGTEGWGGGADGLSQVVCAVGVCT